jgi:DNA-binding PadR family transcriptional regulator
MRRRPYEITTSGSALLTERLETMSSFSSRGLARLKAAQP